MHLQRDYEATNLLQQTSFPGFFLGWFGVAGCTPSLKSCPCWSLVAPYRSTRHPRGGGEKGRRRRRGGKRRRRRGRGEEERRRGRRGKKGGGERPGRKGQKEGRE